MNNWLSESDATDEEDCEPWEDLDPADDGLLIIQDLDGWLERVLADRAAGKVPF